MEDKTPWYCEAGTKFPDVYNYDALTGEYIGTSRADPSPLERNVFADPAHSTRKVPPEVQDNAKPVWNGSSWTVVANYRGETWFDKDGNAVEIEKLGHPSESGLQKDKPIIPDPVPTTDDLLSYAANKRYQIETKGITLQGFKIATDDRSKTLITGLSIKARSDPNYTTEWKGENGFVTINAQTILAISDAVLDHVAQCFNREAIISGKIKDGDIVTFAEIDEAYEG